MDDLSFRAEFHRALDPMAPPAPWLAVAVRDGLRQRRRTSQSPRRLRRLTRPAWLLPAVAVLLATAIVLTLVAGGRLLHFNQTVPVRPPTVRPPQQAPAAPAGCPSWANPRVPEQWLWPTKLASGGVAWAQGGLRTTDGGVHWREVSPAGLHAGNPGLYPPGYAEFYLDGDHAWQAGVYGSANSCFDHITVFVTSDGGKSWRQSSPVIVDVPSGYDVGRLQLGFLNARSGWLWALMESQNGDPGFGPFTESYLLSTSDGGLTWNLISRVSASLSKAGSTSNCKPSLAQMTFSSPSRGWLAATCGSDTTLVTDDGGVSWKAKSQPNLCDCWTGVPAFVDEQHGFWKFATGPKFSNSLVSTSDGGITWHVLPPPSSSDFLLALTPTDAEDLWAIVAPPGWSKASQNTSNWSLYHSADGGQTWSLVGQGVPLVRAWIVLFADTKHGMVGQVGVGAVKTQLALTWDGGVTWKMIDPSLQR